MAWSVWVVNNHNGVRRFRPPVKDFSWARSMNGGSSGNSSLQLTDELTSKLQYKDLSEPLRRVWVACWSDARHDEYPVFAGTVQDREYDRDSGVLSMPLQDVWKALQGRLVRDRAASNIVTAKLTYSNLALETLARYAIEAGMGTPSNDWLLPFTFPTAKSGSHARTWQGFDFETVSDVLDELMKTAGGPDIDFRPFWGAPTSDPQLYYGARLGVLTGSTWSYNLSAPDCALTRVKYLESGADVVTHEIATGDGSEKNLRLAHGRTDGLGYGVERVTAYSSVKKVSELQGLADSARASLSTTTAQWSFSIPTAGVTDADGRLVSPCVADLRLGDVFRIISKNDPMIPDGVHTLRLIRFSGNLGPVVDLGVQPI